MLHRRDALLRLGQFGFGALSLPRLLRAETEGGAARKKQTKRARSCILIYLWGGPAQQDTFDPKPEAPEGIRSLFAPIATRVPGIFFCEHLPMLAQQADKLAVIRSLSHEFNDHGQGVYVTITGQHDAQKVFPRNRRSRRDFPHPGAIVSKFLASDDLPAAVTLPRPVGHDGVIYSGTHAGFLGPRYDPLELQPPAEVSEGPMFCLDPPAGLNRHDLVLRQGMLHRLEQLQRRLEGSNVTGFDTSRQQAWNLLTSPRTWRAFRLDEEPPPLLDRYGRTEFGEAFLLARRLVEAGVRLVTIVWYYVAPDGNVANVWDTHGGTPSLGNISGFDMLKRFYCLPALDRAASALLEDLHVRGLLQETLVAMFGEFGRTPQINKTGGREHWGPCQSAVLAGGGIRGGQLYGVSDRQGGYPIRDPVSPEDLLATIFHTLGVDPATEINDSEGRPQRISQGTPITALF
ncbi:MAG: hypothetical protein KatS3mg113_0364 [Planctomycetaceae bacterium]|nr:MAG: hypothetical protein KatS3mg113_0364 [Planctomycetaceae bacterium]